jgi:16S rRNA (guanine527-N7)-methyltransferase
LGKDEGPIEPSSSKLRASAAEPLAGPQQAPPPTPDVATVVFGSRVSLAERYVELLADTGISHGLLGPREAPRLWDRHVLNCAVVHPLFETGAHVADLGSGAGLPGIPLAIVRPDLRLTLVEPLLRRTTWLTAAVEELGLDNIVVHHGRAESLWGGPRYRHVTGRAVARIGELARIALPLVEAKGSLHALKGSSAVAELTEDAEQLRSLNVSRWTMASFGAGVVTPETVVVTVEVDEVIHPGRRQPRSAGQPRQRGGSRASSPRRPL